MSVTPHRRRHGIPARKAVFVALMVAAGLAGSAYVAADINEFRTAPKCNGIRTDNCRQVTLATVINTYDTPVSRGKLLLEPYAAGETKTITAAPFASLPPPDTEVYATIWKGRVLSIREADGKRTNAYLVSLGVSMITRFLLAVSVLIMALCMAVLLAFRDEPFARNKLVLAGVITALCMIPLGTATVAASLQASVWPHPANALWGLAAPLAVWGITAPRDNRKL